MEPPVLKALTWFRKFSPQSLRPAGLAVDESSSMSPYRKLHRLWASGHAIALQAPIMLARREQKHTRTGGPDDDEDDELRRLMPILAAVITIAVVFGQ
jgi:hypothetical protein